MLSQKRKDRNFYLSFLICPPLMFLFFALDLFFLFSVSWGVLFFYFLGFIEGN